MFCRKQRVSFSFGFLVNMIFSILGSLCLLKSLFHIIYYTTNIGFAVQSLKGKVMSEAFEVMNDGFEVTNVERTIFEIYFLA